MLGGRDSNIYKCLNKKDPVDRVIIDLKKEGIVDIGVVELKGNCEDFKNDYSKNNLQPKGKHTS